LSFSRTVTNCREAFINGGQQWRRWDRGRETGFPEIGPTDPPSVANGRKALTG
jgi:hypothetical protein